MNKWGKQEETQGVDRGLRVTVEVNYVAIVENQMGEDQESE
jgi:hypothetical protein